MPSGVSTSRTNLNIGIYLKEQAAWKNSHIKKIVEEVSKGFSAVSMLGCY